jgi:hypothetical protein
MDSEELEKNLENLTKLIEKEHTSDDLYQSSILESLCSVTSESASHRHHHKRGLEL